MKRFIAIALSALLLCACNANNIVVTLRASNSTNPDVNHQALPVAIKLFQLTSQQLFLASSVLNIWYKTNSSLKHTLLSSKTVLMPPGTTKTLQLKSNKNTRFLGVVALFHQSHASEKQIIHITPGALEAINLVLTKNHLKIRGDHESS